MASKTRIQPIDPTPVFGGNAADENARRDALRTQVLPRIDALKQVAQTAAAETFGFDVARDSDEATIISADEVASGLHPAVGDYSALRNVHSPAFSLLISAVPDGLSVMFRVTGAAEWRLFVKALYQYREALGDYLGEFDELNVLNSDGEEEVIEELDQLFAIDVDADHFKQHGCSIYFPGLDYPVESEDDYDTITGDFATLFPLYWTLLKAAQGESVDMDQLLNG